LKNTTWFKEEG